MDSFLPSHNLDLNEKDYERRASTSSDATEDSGYSSIFRTVNSVRVYSSKDEYLVAMIEDLAMWIKMNHFVDINVENFFDCLENGFILCKQAQMVQFAGEEFVKSRNDGSCKLPGKWSNCYLTLPGQCPKFQIRQIYQAFISRDNVANFIGWMRSFGFNESIMFETEDLIARKNVRHVVLALLELARIGGLFGLNVPNLIELEQEIDAEILSELEATKDEGTLDSTKETFEKFENKLKPVEKMNSNQKSDKDITAEVFVKQKITPKPYFPECDIRSLDEMVREVLLECECANQFPMTRLSEGKYLFGEKDLLIFVRILRRHVMVRVGGGWDTLNHLLYKHDPCRREKPDGTLKVSNASNRDSKITSSGFTYFNPVKNSIKKLKDSEPCRDTRSAEIEEITTRVSNIPTSFQQNRKSCGKVQRRSSLQTSKTEVTMTLRTRGSRIPIPCNNRKAIKEIPILKRQTDLLEISGTSSAPGSRRQSPILIKRLIPWK